LKFLISNSIIFALIILATCSPQMQKITFLTGNPASKFCIKNGGVLKKINTPAGVKGLCLFNYKSVCEEWTFFRGQCKPGDCKIVKKKGNKGDGWYSCKDVFLFKVVLEQ